MRITDSRADRLQLRSSDTLGSLFWAAVFLASALALAWFLAAREPERTTGFLVGVAFCLFGAAAQVWRARTLHIELSRYGPSRGTETTSLIRHREFTFDAASIVGLRVRTERRFDRYGTTAKSPEPSPTFTPIARSILTAALSDGRSLELGWRRGLWSSDRRLRRDAEHLAGILAVPVQ